MKRKRSPQEQLLIRLVEGQVRSFIHDHPDAVAVHARKYAPTSLAKRIVGDILSPDTVRRLAGSVGREPSDG